jgi:hypothetical protein
MDETIAKRTGSVGSKGYKLLVSMELVHDKNLYKRILVSGAFETKGNKTYVNDREASATSATRRVLILVFHIATNQ